VNRRDPVSPGVSTDDVADAAAALRAEWRAEEERWSRAALEQWEHRRTLADVVLAAMHRGDRVTVLVADVAWSGWVIGVGHDVARIATGGILVDVRLGSAAPLVLRVHAGRDDGHRGDPTVTTFTARLRELDGTEVCIGTQNGPVEGILRTGRDHVRLTDGQGAATYVPAASISWVRPLDVD
jgi:hypothetical protein